MGQFNIYTTCFTCLAYMAKSSQWLGTFFCFSLSKYFLDSLKTDSPWINARSFTSVCCVGNTSYLSNGYKFDYAKRLLFLFHLYQKSNVPINVANVWNMTLNQDPFGTIRNFLGVSTENQNNIHDETNTDIPRLTQESLSGRWSASTRMVKCMCI
jgi:hypothetical protein